MTKHLTCIFLLLTSLALINGNHLPSSLNLRNLASTDSSSIKTYDLVKYGKNYAINVDLGDEYLKRTNMTRKNETAMVVLLYGSTTAFCSTCLETVEYDCTNNSCQADKTVEQSFVSLHYVFRQSNPINQTVLIGGSTNNAPWSLATNASLHSFSFTDHKHIYTESSFEHYISNKSTYGVLGLGVDKGAASNFKGDHPLFSISMNPSGNGQLIFGKNSSLYDASTTPTVLPTDANWTMITQNITFGPNYTNNTFTSDIVFDLQFPGIGLPWSYWSDHWAPIDFFSNLERNYKVKRNDTFGVENFPYTYYGNLSNLPNLTITMTNNQTITIPPSVYTRKSPKANDTYAILIDRTNLIQEKVYAMAPGRNCTVLGWPVLAHFYTIFEQKNGSQTITLYPAITPKSSENPLSSFTGARIVQVIAVLGILIVVYVCFKRRAAAKLESELGEELRANSRP